MPRRQSHTKSRHGCQQCKARHIRCDQQQPQCGFCQRRNQPCSLGATISILNSGKLLPRASVFTLPKSPISSRTCSLQASSPIDKPTSPLPLVELELLHHFSSVVAIASVELPSIQEAWRDAVPKLALHHQYLMYAIFAVSSLHLHVTDGGLDPRHEYLDRALRYYETSSSQFRCAMESVSDNDNNSTEAMFTSSVLLYMFSLGSGIRLCPPGAIRCLDDIVTLRKLAYGTFAMVQKCQKSMNSMIAKALLLPDPWDDVVLPPATESQFMKLTEYVDSVSDSHSRRRQTCQSAIRALNDQFRALSANPQRSTMPFYWYMTLEEDFVDLIDERDTVALVIVAHHAQLLKQYGHIWWIGRRGDWSMDEICHSLGENFRDISAWPPDTIEL